MISEGGFDEFPYLLPRWSKLTGEHFGRSPAMTVLPDTKMVNAMTRTVIVGAKKQVDPPLIERSVRISLGWPVRPVPTLPFLIVAAQSIVAVHWVRERSLPHGDR